MNLEPHVFMSEAALGLHTHDNKRVDTWWVAVDGVYYVLMSSVLGECMSWYKCGLAFLPNQPNNVNAARPDQGNL